MYESRHVFNEQLVKKEHSLSDLIKQAGIIVVAVIILFVIFLQFTFAIIVIAPIEVIVIAFLFKRVNIEYEYILTNSELDIDKIYNKASRKRGITVDVKNFTIIVPIMNSEYTREINSYDKIVDYSSGVLKNNTYVAIFNKDGKRYKLIFEPNEKLLKSIKMYCPSTLKK